MDARTGLQLDPLWQAVLQAAETARLGVLVSFADRFDLVYTNGAVESLLGRTRQELENIDVWSLFDESEREQLRAVQAARALGEQANVSVETVACRPDGTRVPVELSVARVQLGGRPADVAFFVDISHRRRAEEALANSERSFKELIEHAPDGITIVRWPNIVFVNRTAARLLGFHDPQALIGRRLTDLMPPEEAKLASERALSALRDGQRHAPYQYTGRDPDGRKLAVEISAVPIEYDGAPAMVAFARDVTARNAIVDKLRETDKLAAVGTLAAGIAHEINNPLGYLLLNLDLTLRELPRLLDEPERLDVIMQRLRDSRQGAERLKTIVRELQTFTRRDDEIRGPVDLRSVLDSVLHMARHELAGPITLAPPPQSMPPVYGNETRLEQLFLNILLNAAHSVKESAPSEPRIEVAFRVEDGAVIVTVRDNGPGMTEEVLGRVFEPFFTTKPQGVGTGLGLPICQGIVRGLGGQIQIDSRPGAGTKVTLRLPTAPAGSETG